jgi:HEAT repeat protein
MRPELTTRCIACWVLIVVGFVCLPSCVTVEEHGPRPWDGHEEESSPLLQKQIEKRIEGLRFQRGVALLDSLNWLILYGEYANPQLIEALHDPDPRTRSYAAYVLGEIGDDAIVPELREALQTEKRKLVRYEIAASLVTLGDWAQLGILIQGLEETSPVYRFKCFEILRKNLNLTFSFDPNGSEDERAEAMKKWHAWWTQNRDNFTPVLKKPVEKT